MNTLGTIADLRARLFEASPKPDMPGRRRWREAMRRAQWKRNEAQIRLGGIEHVRADYGLSDAIDELKKAVDEAERKYK